MARIRIVGLATGQPTKASGLWVKSYTPDGFGGRGDLVLTENQREAKVYESATAAIEDWQRVSATHPRRPGDGKPNRPMSAFTIEVR